MPHSDAKGPDRELVLDMHQLYEWISEMELADHQHQMPQTLWNRHLEEKEKPKENDWESSLDYQRCLN